jgi:predicted DNA-binding antitoxin AbrB/MazE fold protein
MTPGMTFEATYENGVLKPAGPLPLPEHEKVTVVIQSSVSLARQTAGMIPWTGDAETLERLACDPEFGILESP